VHKALGFPFQPSSIIAILPISHHGFGFPSIAWINAGLVVEGLIRDLNHHKPAYHALAKITLLDCMCKKNDCSYSLGGDGLKTDFSHLDQSISSAWLTAHQVLKKLDLSLVEIHYGRWSLTHCPFLQSQQPTDTGECQWDHFTLPLSQRCQKACWHRQLDDHHSCISAHLIQLVFDRSWSTAIHLNWWKLFDMLYSQAHIDHVLCGSTDLAISRLLTNHLTAVWLVEDIQSGVDQMAHLQFMNGWSYYCWLLALTTSGNS